MRLVLDSNVLVSALLNRGSVPRRVTDHAMEEMTPLFSFGTLAELLSVLHRKAAQGRILEEEKDEFVKRLKEVAELVRIKEEVEICRDPDDEKFLDVALAGEADAIVTGDKDLLELNPFRGIPIITPREFLEKYVK